MEHVIPIPKRFETVTRTLRQLVQSPSRQIFQSELKRLVSTKSWRRVVKRELDLWNRLIAESYPGYSLLTIQQRRNPRTSRINEFLYSLHPGIDLAERESHFRILIRREGVAD